MRVGVAGLGTVGGGPAEPPVASGRISRRPGSQVAVTGVCARVAHARRGRSTSPTCPGSTIRWRWRASPDNDVFVELIGGSDGPAKAAVEAALQARQAGGHRQQGADRRARRGTGRPGRGQGRVPLLFEAAVMGGTPAVKMLREAMVGDEVESRRRHPQRHLQLHPHRDGGDRPRLRRRAGRGPAAGLRRGRSRPWTSAASTPPTRSPSWPPWPSAARPTYAAAEIEGIDDVEPARHPPGPRPRLPHQAGGQARRSPRGRRGARASGAGAARPSAGPDRRRAQRAVHRGPAHRRASSSRGRAPARARPPRPSPPTSPM